MNVRTIVVTTDLLLVLVLGVNDDLWDEVEEDVFEEGGGKVEFSPVVALFHDVEDVACMGMRVRRESG